jgi:hypothetical protein
MGFLLRYPKLLGAGVMLIALAAFGVHYKLLTGERDQLRLEKVSYQLALKKAALNMEILTEDARIAELATANAIFEREASRAALDAFRAGREDDPEALTWGAQLIPLGEIARLCLAVPEMNGCQNIPTTH